jgi:NAD dependent epimerase/dehydratase
MILKDKKVLITGADGFIGSHLTEMLIDKSTKVTALSYYNSFNHWGWLDTVDCLNEVEVITGDIRDAHFCRRIVKDVDIVFHLAALIAIPYSYIAPESYVDINVKGTLNICQAGLENGCERIIHTSTSEVYGTAQYMPIDEKHPLSPQSPYSATKIGADAIAESFYRSFQLPVVIARPFNTYGPRQSARAVIPTIITQLLNSGKEIKLGSLHPTRDLNYVVDICRGIISLAECDNAVGKTVNIGSGREISIGNLAELIIGLAKTDARVICEDNRKRPDNSEVERLVCDNKLMINLTGWRPEIDLKEGLLKTLEWFRDTKNLIRYKSDIYNL